MTTPGPWSAIKDTKLGHVNLFGLKPNEGRHIGTIISGSRSQLAQFYDDCELIAATPKLVEALQRSANATVQRDNRVENDPSFDAQEFAEKVLRECGLGVTP